MEPHTVQVSQTIERALERYGYQVMIGDCHFPQPFWHWHAGLEIALFHAGRAKVFSRSWRSSLFAGDVVFSSGQVEHGSQGKFSRTVLHFVPDLVPHQHRDIMEHILYSSAGWELALSPDAKGRFIWVSQQLAHMPRRSGHVPTAQALIGLVMARFRVRTTGQEFLFLNGHYHHIDSGEVVRRRSSEVVMERVQQLAGGLPIVFVGDFNTQPHTPAYQVLVEGEDALFSDAWTMAAQRRGPSGTFHGFTGEARGRRIDWVLVSDGIRVIEVEHIAMRQGDVFPSDHYPVYASLCLAQ